MMDIPRTATIQAVESSLLLELSQKNFRHFITIVPGEQAETPQRAAGQQIARCDGAGKPITGMSGHGCAQCSCQLVFVSWRCVVLRCCVWGVNRDPAEV